MLQPMGNYVLIKREVEEDNKKVNGIIMTKNALSAISSLHKGEVVAVGDGITKDGVNYPITNVIVGDTVYWSGMGFDVDTDTTLVSHDSIIAKDAE